MTIQRRSLGRARTGWRTEQAATEACVEDDALQIKSSGKGKSHTTAMARRPKHSCFRAICYLDCHGLNCAPNRTKADIATGKGTSTTSQPFRKAAKLVDVLTPPLAALPPNTLGNFVQFMVMRTCRTDATSVPVGRLCSRASAPNQMQQSWWKKWGVEPASSATTHTSPSPTARLKTAGEVVRGHVQDAS